MKKFFWILNSTIIAAALLVGVVSCKKSSESVTFSLSALKAGTIDLNGSTSATGVPVSPTIVATFSVDVNASTANATNITLKNNVDNSTVDLTITVTGSSITITPTSGLGTGTEYLLTFSGLKSTDDQTLATTSRSFTTEGSYAPPGYFAYWNFENNLDDALGNFDADASVNITYQASHSTAAGMAAFFDGTTSIAEIPNGHLLMNTADFSIAFWIKAISTGHVDSSGNQKGQFVFGLGAFKGFEFEIAGDYGSCKLAAQYNESDTASASEDLWFAGDGNLGWQGWTYCRDLTTLGGVAALLKDQWAFVVCTYDHNTKIGSMYINGEIMKTQDFNLWPAGDPKTGVVGLIFAGTEPEAYDIFALGFIYSRQSTLFASNTWGNYASPYANHFGGLLDDLYIYHSVLTASQIQQMYASSK
jgi:hypothetical protein